MLWDREKIAVAIQENNQITVLLEAELLTSEQAGKAKAKVKEAVVDYLKEALSE